MNVGLPCDGCFAVKYLVEQGHDLFLEIGDVLLAEVALLGEVNDAFEPQLEHVLGEAQFLHGDTGFGERHARQQRLQHAVDVAEDVVRVGVVEFAVLFALAAWIEFVLRDLDPLQVLPSCELPGGDADVLGQQAELGQIHGELVGGPVHLFVARAVDGRVGLAEVLRGLAGVLTLDELWVVANVVRDAPLSCGEQPHPVDVRGQLPLEHLAVGDEQERHLVDELGGIFAEQSFAGADAGRPEERCDA